jgi:hypothetical protein
MRKPNLISKLCVGENGESRMDFNGAYKRMADSIHAYDVKCTLHTPTACNNFFSSKIGSPLSDVMVGTVSVHLVANKNLLIKVADEIKLYVV